MDEKKVREAIAWMGNERRIHKYGIHVSPSIPREQINMSEEYYNLVIEALEKQLPKKPIIKSEKEVPHTHNLGRLLRFHCPNCGRFIVGMYETDTERGGRISNSLKGCSTCLQAIDFSEYYSNLNKDKLNEELQWDD